MQLKVGFFGPKEDAVLSERLSNITNRGECVQFCHFLHSKSTAFRGDRPRENIFSECTCSIGELKRLSLQGKLFAEMVYLLHPAASGCTLGFTSGNRLPHPPAQVFPPAFSSSQLQLLDGCRLKFGFR
jgi:hypothetical protein